MSIAKIQGLERRYFQIDFLFQLDVFSGPFESACLKKKIRVVFINCLKLVLFVNAQSVNKFI